MKSIPPNGTGRPIRTYAATATKSTDDNTWEHRVLLVDFGATPKNELLGIERDRALADWHAADGEPSEAALDAWESLRDLLPQWTASLTERQRRVLELWLTGRYSQREIGDMCGICQTSVHKTIWGNLQRDGLYHGGIVNKFRDLARRDPRVAELLAKLHGEDDET